MVQAVNNENEHRLTRSKVQQQLIETVDDDRQSLGDVSNQYGIIGKSTKKVKTNSGVSKANVRRSDPLVRVQGQEISQRVQRLKTSQKAELEKENLVYLEPEMKSKENLDKENILEKKTQLKDSLRLPQKRPATELSTNLVEKLNVQASPASDPNSYKRTRLIDYEWQDLDEEDHDDPLMALEYVSEIFTYFYELETRMLPDPKYLYTQGGNMNPRMRGILVDSLVDMHLRFRLLPESLFLAINLMDRFMSLEVVQIDRLQLLATGSLFIAAKYEEVFAPSVKNYAHLTQGAYTEEEILQAEKYMLTVLSFDLNYPNPMNFLRRISKADDYDVQLRTLGKYLLEITVIDHNFIGMKPSLCCALAMYLARLILRKSPVWNGNLIHYLGGYRVNDMKKCVELIFQYLIAEVEHGEFFKKYATRKFMRASILCRSWAKRFNLDGKDLFEEGLSTHKIALE